MFASCVPYRQLGQRRSSSTMISPQLVLPLEQHARHLLPSSASLAFSLISPQLSYFLIFSLPHSPKPPSRHSTPSSYYRRFPPPTEACSHDPVTASGPRVQFPALDTCCFPVYAITGPNQKCGVIVMGLGEFLVRLSRDKVCPCHPHRRMSSCGAAQVRGMITQR